MVISSQRSWLVWAGLFLALFVQVSAVGYYFGYFQAYGYLPAPFIYNKFDTFMDLYNTMYWGGELKYTIWQSVYPPLNFLILDLLRFAIYGANSTIESSLDMREVSLAPAYILCLIHVITPFIVVMMPMSRGFPVVLRLMIAVGAVLSAPLLFSMERGNLIILALLVFPFVFSARLTTKAIAVALLINLKPYFVLLLLVYVIREQWRTALLATAFSGGVFISTGLLTDPNFPLFLANILSFSQNDAILSGREVIAFPSSVSAFAYVIAIGLKNSSNADAAIALLLALSSLIEIVKLSVIAFLIGSLILGRKVISEAEFITSFVAIIINMGIWAGGYSQIFYFACVPVILGMRLWWLNITLIILIFMPLDTIVIGEEYLGLSFSFLSQDIRDLTWQIGVGSILRPILGLMLCFSLACEFLSRSFYMQPRSMRFYPNVA